MCPSVNGLFATNFKTKRRFQSKKYREWIELAKTYKNKTGEYKGGKTTLNCKFYSKWHNNNGEIKKKDVSNYIKAIEDFIPNLIRNFDDSSIFKITVEKVESDREEVEITIN